MYTLINQTQALALCGSFLGHITRKLISRCIPYVTSLDISEERKVVTNFSKHFIWHCVLRDACLVLSFEQTFSYAHHKQKITNHCVLWDALLGYSDERTFSYTHRTKRVVRLCEFWDACSVLSVEWTIFYIFTGKRPLSCVHPKMFV
jgi:hypothetical protein